MGQEPNISLGFEDLPRPTPKPAPARRWSPRRPGEIDSPEESPWGGMFGTPAPDMGYGLLLVRERDLPGGPGLRRDIEAAVLAVVSARASAIGRAPTSRDIDVALELLDLGDDAGAERLRGVSRDKGRMKELVAAIPREQLTRT